MFKKWTFHLLVSETVVKTCFWATSWCFKSKLVTMHWYSRDLSITSQAHPKPYITETSQQDHNLIKCLWYHPTKSTSNWHRHFWRLCSTWFLLTGGLCCWSWNKILCVKNKTKLVLKFLVLTCPLICQRWCGGSYVYRDSDHKWAWLCDGITRSDGYGHPNWPL